MSTGIGLRVGSVVSTAVIASNAPGSPDPLVLSRDSVLYLLDDGTAVLGGPHPAHAAAVSALLAHIGARTAVEVTEPDGTNALFRPQDLAAGAVACLVELTTPMPKAFLEADAAAELAAAPRVLAYPTRWSRREIDALREGLNFAGLGDLDLLSDAEAVAIWYASEVGAVSSEAIVADVHLDDEGSTIALVRGFSLAGSPHTTAGRGGQPASALAMALGSYGYLPSNLAAIVLTADGLVARDRALLRDTAALLRDRYAVPVVIGPGPEQTPALGAAIAATGFRGTGRGNRTEPVGPAPSNDATESIPVLTPERLQELDGGDVAAPSADLTAGGPAADDAGATGTEAPSAIRTRWVIGAAVAAVVLVIAVVLWLMLG